MTNEIGEHLLEGFAKALKDPKFAQVADEIKDEVSKGELSKDQASKLITAIGLTIILEQVDKYTQELRDNGELTPHIEAKARLMYETINNIRNNQPTNEDETKNEETEDDDDDDEKQ